MLEQERLVISLLTAASILYIAAATWLKHWPLPAMLAQRSNFTLFFHSNPKFMVNLIDSLKLPTFSFETFSCENIMAEANQIYNCYKLLSFYDHLNQCCQAIWDRILNS